MSQGIIFIEFHALFKKNKSKKVLAPSVVQALLHFIKYSYRLIFLSQESCNEELKNIIKQILYSENVQYHEIILKNNINTAEPQLQRNLKNFVLSHSYVIAEDRCIFDRFGSLNIQKICFKKVSDNNIRLVKKWNDTLSIIKKKERIYRVHRKTKETDILIHINLDGSGSYHIDTGIGFFNHMLEQFSKHSLCDLDIHVTGDLHIDEHHSVEDTALALGEAFLHALGDKRKIERYGFVLPMDDALAQVAIDFGGRSWLEWNVQFKREKIGDMPTELFFHFFKSFCDSAKCNLNIKAEGKIEHHKIESIYKCFAKAIKIAVMQDERNQDIPSTKGSL